MKKISVIPYIGGKYYLIDEIVPIIEWCASEYSLRNYFELCGGGARMLLNISPTLFQHRLYNDIDLGLAKLFACLRDPILTHQMMKKLLDLGYSEETFVQAQKLYNDEHTDLVTAAAYTYLVAHQSRAGNMNSFNKNGQDNPYYFSTIYGLQSYSVILKGIDVSCGDALTLLEENNHREDSFCYLDVPYVTESKLIKGATYAAEKEKPFDHEGMVNSLLSTEMKVALSGYSNHHFYDRLEENGWRKLFLKDQFIASSSTTGKTASEYLWINFRIPKYILHNNMKS
ncbi:DNA adenine methylase [Rummeliibacillus suwonensis]|uniref:DNA adenine methylase n=1 Tax=Rummeliibacillus suwonensis TaxID=1306154 RepID=UPI00289B18F5|nr:DNA adenine methylase [Rummeliibacillus suwonensis]